MSLMQQFADPTMFESLSMGERLTGATVTMLMGLGITFSILIILWVCIAIISRTVGAASKKTEKAAAAPAEAAAAAPAPAAAPEAAEPVDETDNAELVAVIAAAVAASENTLVNNLVVRKITRVSGPSNAWGSAGLGECVDSRKM